MKYVAIALVIGFIAFTTWFSKRADELSVEQMERMNAYISRYMTQAVQANQPEATEIEFLKIYTEVIEKGRKMRANFKFSYMEPNSDGELEKVFREGSFLITSNDGNQWQAKIETAGDTKVEFVEPFEITSE